MYSTRYARIVLLLTILPGVVCAIDDMEIHREKVSLLPNSFYTTNFLLMKDAEYTVQVSSNKKVEFRIFAHPKSDFHKSGAEGNLKCPGFYGHKTKTLVTNVSSSKTTSGIFSRQIGHYGVYIENKSKKKIHFTIEHKVSKGKFVYTYHK